MDNVVEYWEDFYVQRYMGDCYGDVYLSQVDSAVLYDGIDALTIKAVGETTGVDGIEWFSELDPPDIRFPFSAMVRILIGLHKVQ